MRLKMKRKTTSSIAAIAMFFSVEAVAQLTITPMDSAEAMAQALAGPGIEISNVQFSGAEYSAGYFTGGYAPGNDISEGVILTSGKASYAGASENTSNSKGYNTGGSGDSTLGTLIPGYSTYDATVLSFDFVSSGDSAYFNYSFASEEYTEWVGSSYNDVFGFFVNGENVALIPDTDTAVSISSVSDVTNSDLFNDNTRQGGEAPYAFEYDGFTDVFTAAITGLEAGETYSIMLGIADAGDHIYDSAVFLEAGSFSEEKVEVVASPSGAPEPHAALLMTVAVSSLFIRMRRLSKKSD